MPIDAHGGTYTKMPKTGKFGRSFLDATDFDYVRAKKEHARRACSCVGNKKHARRGVFVLCNVRMIMRYALLGMHRP